MLLVRCYIHFNSHLPCQIWNNLVCRANLMCDIVSNVTLHFVLHKFNWVMCSDCWNIFRKCCTYRTNNRLSCLFLTWNLGWSSLCVHIVFCFHRFIVCFWMSLSYQCLIIQHLLISLFFVSRYPQWSQVPHMCAIIILSNTNVHAERGVWTHNQSAVIMIEKPLLPLAYWATKFHSFDGYFFVFP